MGYKFYETADEEGFLDYDAAVQYPFGYGLSYTQFTQEMGAMTADGDGNLIFDVTVTNTGDQAGKDVVEVYYTPPYYNGGIEKASVNLIDFAKTDLLEPGRARPSLSPLLWRIWRPMTPTDTAVMCWSTGTIP